MDAFISVVHCLIALTLVGLVLVQDSKGGGALGIGGGGSNSLLGATGAQTLAAKLTRIAAVLFACTCLGLSYLTSRGQKSVIDSGVISAAGAAAVPSSVPGASPLASPIATPLASPTPHK